MKSMSNFLKINEYLYSIDNFLEPESFNCLTKIIDNYVFHPTGKDDPSSIWHFNGDYNPRISQNIVWTPDDQYRRALRSVPGLSVFPTGTFVDTVLDKIHEAAINSNLFGGLGESWLGTLSSIYKYDLGKRLIWHTDSHNYTGAFTYYLHTTWNENWGGYLLYKSSINEFGQSEKQDGGFLSPSPNRLVLLKSPMPHSITPVTSPLEYPRIALTGFFVKPDRVVELMKRFTRFHNPD
jgi:hypothetical protein